MSALPTLVTERLVLRPFDPIGDAASMVALTSDPDTMRYLDFGRPWTPEETAQMMARHAVQYPEALGFGAVIDRATSDLVGWSGLQHPKRWMAKVISHPLPADTVEVGWALGPEWRGRGYATEAAAAWLDHGFGSLGLDEIVAVHDPANVASEHVMDRLGMARRETLQLVGDETLCLHVLTRAARESERPELGGRWGNIGTAVPTPLHRTSEMPAESGATS